MDLSLSALLALARFTVQNPREGARYVMQANLPLAARWAAFGLMVVASAMMSHLSFALLPAEVRLAMDGAMASPFGTAILQGGLMLGAVAAMHRLGRWRGGSGQFEDALILMVWLQFILLLLQVVQVAVQFFAPGASIIVGYISVAIFLWLLSNFIAELHQFPSVWKTFFAILLTLFSFGMALTVVLSLVLGTGV